MNGVNEYNQNLKDKIQSFIYNSKNYRELDGFYAYMKPNKSYNTIYNYLRTTEHFLNYTGNKSVQRLNFDDFSKFFSHAIVKKDGKETVSGGKVFIYHGLKTYGEYLVAKGSLKENPMNRIKRPSPKESQETIKKRNEGFLTPDEIKRYIFNIKFGVGTPEEIKKRLNWKERDLSIIMIFLSTGIRCSALYKLDIGSIDLEKQTLMVTDKGNSVKEYELSGEVIEVLKKWLDVRKSLPIEKKETALFVSNRLSRISDRSIANIVTKYTEGITEKNITPHKLRATYGTQLYEATKDLYFVQECMGHASPVTTERYIRGQENKTKKASAIMSNLLD